VIWIILAIVVVVVAVLVLVIRRPRQEPGVTSFRRHIDALSPEARREVMDRVRPPQPQADDDTRDTRDHKEGPAN
jgi:regulator of protease activity HflC (stomatin/prohibitin superfamily)